MERFISGSKVSNNFKQLHGELVTRETKTTKTMDQDTDGSIRITRDQDTMENSV